MKRFINSTVTFSVTVTIAVIIFFLLSPVTSLGSGSTYAVVYGSDTVCALISGQPTQRILCYDTRLNINVTLNPGVSFSSIAAGDNFLCGIRSGGYSLLCWDNIGSYSPNRKRIYQNDNVLLETLSVGDKQICATVNGTNSLKCWRGSVSDQSKPPNERFRSISSGVGFSCGVSIRNNRILCWGTNPVKSNQIQTGFGNTPMVTISAGKSHACGLNTTGNLICIGNNDSGQLNVITPDQPNLYSSSLSLGSNFTCAMRISNNSVVCWGGGAERFNNVTDSISFESISSGPGLICGLISSNLSIMCWNPTNFSRIFLPFPEVLPGPCVESSSSSLCSCGVYPQSDKLCSGTGSICKSCPIQFPASPPSQFPLPPPPPPPPPSPSTSSPPSKALTRGLLAFAIVGSVGAFAGICSVVYCLWTGVCLGKKKVHNSVQPTITRGGSNSRSNSSNSRSLSIRRQGSRMLSMRRQRSGTSSMKHADKAEEFSFSELASATGNFSLENKIGSGSFGVVYRGKLNDGREVAIKRGEVNAKMKKFQEKETAFDSEIANNGDVEEEEGCVPVHLVDYSVPAITADELSTILDPRVGSPELGEGDAVELVAYTAMHCVNAEGRNRPTMTDIVGNLERALDLCGDSHGSISSGICSIVSD
ncbi:unnamed protein product [Arabidopsis thaliana]|uniref:non-specific serine/threonine protein kinase n=1 Tax=Arabidopsis thaliana TaxID=3702 RepID=A0A7G2EXS7_ARATH|nr:unnamed protein product [Arabidopsis thaliana]